MRAMRAKKNRRRDRESDRHTVQVKLRLAPDDAKELREQARALDITVSGLVAMMVGRYFGPRAG